MRCAPGDSLHPGRHGQGTIHSGDLPAQLPVGLRPAAGPSEPGAAGPGLDHWGTTLVLSRRVAHPFGSSPHFTSSPALALGKPVQWHPSTIASPSISCLTAPLAPDPSTRLLNCPEGSRQVGPRASLVACFPDNLAQHRHHGPPTSPWRGYRTLHSAKSMGIKPSRLFPLPLIPSLTTWLHPLGGSGTRRLLYRRLLQRGFC